MKTEPKGIYNLIEEMENKSIELEKTEDIRGKGQFAFEKVVE